MALHPVYGHETLLERLAGGVASGHFPQAVLLIGAPGVGKQRLALWTAQALLCAAPRRGYPCGQCDACTRVTRLTHPDVHWFIPIPRPKAQESSKQLEEAEASIGETIAERREKPLYERPDGMASHSLASVRLLQRRALLTPAMARLKVLIVGDAERLVVQEASPEAANAMLKVLEEPLADTVLLLTAADPQALLPTIRSRVVPVRVAPVPDATVSRFLVEQDSAKPGPALERRVLAAEGSIGRAIWAREQSDTADGAAERLLAAISRGGTAPWLAAIAQPPWSARGEFTALLDALTVKLRARLAAGHQDQARMRGWARAVRRVETVRSEAQGNANPQLALAVLAQDLERLL